MQSDSLSLVDNTTYTALAALVTAPRAKKLTECLSKLKAFGERSASSPQRVYGPIVAIDLAHGTLFGTTLMTILSVMTSEMGVPQLRIVLAAARKGSWPAKVAHVDDTVLASVRTVFEFMKVNDMSTQLEYLLLATANVVPKLGEPLIANLAMIVQIGGTKDEMLELVADHISGSGLGLNDQVAKKSEERNKAIEGYRNMRTHDEESNRAVTALSTTVKTTVKATQQAKKAFSWTFDGGIKPEKLEAMFAGVVKVSLHINQFLDAFIELAEAVMASDKLAMAAVAPKLDIALPTQADFEVGLEGISKVSGLRSSEIARAVTNHVASCMKFTALTQSLTVADNGALIPGFKHRTYTAQGPNNNLFVNTGPQPAQQQQQQQQALPQPTSAVAGSGTAAPATAASVTATNITEVDFVQDYDSWVKQLPTTIDGPFLAVLGKIKFYTQFFPALEGKMDPTLLAGLATFMVTHASHFGDMVTLDSVKDDLQMDSTVYVGLYEPTSDVLRLDRAKVLTMLKMSAGIGDGITIFDDTDEAKMDKLRAKVLKGNSVSQLRGDQLMIELFGDLDEDLFEEGIASTKLKALRVSMGMVVCQLLPIDGKAFYVLNPVQFHTYFHLGMTILAAGLTLKAQRSSNWFEASWDAKLSTMFPLKCFGAPSKTQ